MQQLPPTVTPLGKASIFHVITTGYLKFSKVARRMLYKGTKQRTTHIHANTYFTRRNAMNTQTEKINAWDRIMMAITFAEANEAGTAREVISKRPAARIRKESVRRPELRV